MVLLTFPFWSDDPMRAVVCLLVLTGLVLSLAARVRAGDAPNEAPVFEIPRLERTAPDAAKALEAWKDQGFRIDLFPDKDGRLKSAEDFDVKARLAWNDAGILFLVQVRDDMVVEDPDPEMIWSKDSVELFVSPKVGASEYTQLFISPGCDPKQPEVRAVFNTRLKAPKPHAELKALVSRQAVVGGYVLEVLLPWANLNLTPKEGDEIGVQIFANDFDPKGARGGSFNGIWFPIPDASRNPQSLHRVKLSKLASAPVGFGASAQYEHWKDIAISVVAGDAQAGQDVSFVAGDKELAKGKLEARDGRAALSVRLPMPAAGVPTLPIEVRIQEHVAKRLELPDADFLRMNAFMQEKVLFDALCFAGRGFPRAEFEHPDLVEKLIGPYSLKATFYDAQGNVAASPDKPGRYAAVVEITHGGRVSKRFRTLCRVEPGTFNPRGALKDAVWPNSGPTGISGESEKAAAAELSALAAKSMQDALTKDPAAAELFASLWDRTQNSKELDALPLKHIERQFWVTFKRKFYGTDKLFPNAFVCPKPIEGDPAPVLRAGTPAEAGISEDGVAKIDKLVQEWTEKSGEGMTLCIARHGVIVLNKGYGKQRNGEPVTAATSFPTASSNKFISALILMQAVDQGLVKLDEPVETYVPAMRGIEVKRKMLVRDLYLHTCGFPDHWGDYYNDLEELAADFYPKLPVGGPNGVAVYQGTGIALAGKIMESLTGEVYPVLGRKHLLDPLECAHTEMETTGAGSVSTGEDLAKLAQMALNGGAYGKWRFVSKETIALMSMPPGGGRISADKSIRYGIGVKQYDNDGWSAAAFGHGGGNGAWVMADPERDMVTASTRLTNGKDYEDWRAKLMDATRAAIIDGK